MAKKDHTKTPYILLVVGGIISALFNMFGLASSIVTRQLLIKIAGSTSSELNSLAQESGLTQDMLIQLTIIPNSFFTRIMILSIVGIALSGVLIFLGVKLKEKLQKNYSNWAFGISILLLFGYGFIGAVLGLIGSILALVKTKS
ncbi:hypothetical protein J4414_04435 [Candidatus Woesearchaeota archaeon]|nr:hypothetical protein [Candidatus Woesearchaeota archaeon]